MIVTQQRKKVVSGKKKKKRLKKKAVESKVEETTENVQKVVDDSQVPLIAKGKNDLQAPEKVEGSLALEDIKNIGVTEEHVDEVINVPEAVDANTGVESKISEGQPVGEPLPLDVYSGILPHQHSKNVVEIQASEIQIQMPPGGPAIETVHAVVGQPVKIHTKTVNPFEAKMSPIPEVTPIVAVTPTVANVVPIVADVAPKIAEPVMKTTTTFTAMERKKVIQRQIETNIKTQQVLGTIVDQQMWIKDDQLRLKSDAVYQSLKIKLQAEVKDAVEKFEARSVVHKHSEFYMLLLSLEEAVKITANQVLVLKDKSAQSKREMDALWGVHVNQLTQQKITAEGVNVQHVFEYNESQFDSKALIAVAQHLDEISKKHAPKLALMQHEVRKSYLLVELFLHRLQNDEKKTDAKVRDMCSCLDTLFNFLSLPGMRKQRQQTAARSFQLKKCLHKWVKIVVGWIYKHGKRQDQEYIFQHLIRSRGVTSWGRLLRFPAAVRHWNDSQHWHFLRMLTLLLNPRTGDPNYIESSEGKDEDWIQVKYTTKQQADGPTNVNNDPNSVARAIKASLELRESDFTALLSDFPIKHVLHSVMTNAYLSGSTSGAATGAVTVQMTQAFARLKVVTSAVSEALKVFTVYPQFTKYLCQLLCWITQCIVDSYLSTMGSIELGVQHENSFPFHDVVQRELDWICVRCLASVNTTPTPGCKFFMAEFPLKQLSDSGTSLAFRVIYQGIHHSALTDSNHYTLPLEYHGWRQAMRTNNGMRSRFHSELKSNSDHDFVLLALTTLASKQQLGTDIPKIWLDELFLICFVDPSTTKKMCTSCHPLITTLCAAHPSAVSQLLWNLSEHIQSPQLAEKSADINSIVTELDLIRYEMTRPDVEILRSMLDQSQDTWQAQIGATFLMRAQFVNPAIAADQARSDLKVGGIGDSKTGVTPIPSLIRQREVLQMLAEVRLGHINRVGQESLITRLATPFTPPQLAWWCRILPKIHTHDTNGRPLGPVLMEVPSRERRAKYKMDENLFNQVVEGDAVLAYADLVLTGMGHNVDLFVSKGSQRLLRLLRLPPPACYLGYWALYSLMPGLVARDSNTVLKKDLIQSLLESHRPRGLGSLFRGDTVTFDVTKALANIIIAHIANRILGESLLARAKQPGVAWNSAFKSQSDVKSRTQASAPLPMRILYFWLNQITNGGSSGQGGMLEWLKDHNCRFLMNAAIRGMYVLQPVDAHDRLIVLSRSIRDQIQEHNQAAPRPETQARTTTLPPICVLKSFQPRLMANYGWMTFQILLETTLLDRPNWVQLGHEVVSKGFNLTLKQILKIIAPDYNCNKILLWESMIREWLRHACHLDFEHPLQPLYWQMFFYLYFDQINMTAPTDNPGSFYGFRWLSGKSGLVLVKRAQARLEELQCHYQKKDAALKPKVGHPHSQLAGLFRGMRLWLEGDRKLMVRFEQLGVPQAANASLAERIFLESKCPRGNLEAESCWYLNQLHMRATLGILPTQFAPVNLLSVITEDPMQRDRRNLWHRLLDTEKLVNDVQINTQQFMPKPLFMSVFRDDPLGQGPLVPPQLDRKQSYSLVRIHKLLRKSRQLENHAVQSINEDLSLTIPPRLCQPIWTVLGEETLAAIQSTIQLACKEYSGRVSHLKSLDLEAVSLVPQLWRNDQTTTRVQRVAKRTIFSKQEASTVNFEFRHTKPVQVDHIVARLNDNRTQAQRLLFETPEIHTGHLQIIEDVSSQLLLVGLVVDYLVSESQRSADDQQKRLLSQYAMKWLYAMINLDSVVVRTFPLTNHLINLVISNLNRFIGVDLKSQNQLLATIANHPHLTEQFVPSLQPLGIYTDTKMDPQRLDELHDHYVSLFRSASRIQIQINGSQTQIASAGVLQKFQVMHWLSQVYRPTAKHCMQLLNHITSVLQTQYQLKPPSDIDRDTFHLARDRVQGLLMAHFRSCINFQFPQMYPSTFSLLLESCTRSSPKLPPSLWSMLATTPMQRLRWPVIKATLDQIGVQYQNLRAEAKTRGESVFQSSKLSVDEVFTFVQALLIKALRQLYFVKANVQSRTEAAAEIEVRSKQAELIDSAWRCFAPFLACKTKEGDIQSPWTKIETNSPLVQGVVGRFAQAIALLSCPQQVVFQKDKGAARLWEPDMVMRQLWNLYAIHIAADAELHVLNAVHNALLQRKILPSIPSLPFHSFKLTSELCAQMQNVLKQCHASGKVTAKAKSVSIFLCQVVSAADWKTCMRTNPKDTKSLDCKGVSLVTLCVHIMLLAPLPYPSAFEKILSSFLQLDWQRVNPSEYENLLITCSDLLYKLPGAEFDTKYQRQPDTSQTHHTSSQTTHPDTKSQQALNVRYLSHSTLDHMPSSNVEKAGFVLRLVLAMAQPYPGLHQTQSLQLSLLKLQMYTEWVLSAFHKDGPRPLAPYWFYSMLVQIGVLKHLDDHAAAIKQHCDRDTIVQTLQEIALLNNLASPDHTHPQDHVIVNLIKSFLNSNTNVLPEVITACCRSITSLQALSLSLEQCVVVALARKLKGAGPSAPKFSWQNVSNAFTIPEIMEEEFFSTCVQGGHLLTLHACSVQKLVQTARGALWDTSPSLGGSDDINAAQAHIEKLVSWLGTAANEQMGVLTKVEEIRQFEHKVMTVCRTVVQAQAALVRRLPSDFKLRMAANRCFTALVEFLCNVYQESRFCTSGLGRLGGKILGVVGLGGSQYTPRFRLAARTLATFILLRKVIDRSGANPQYLWREEVKSTSQKEQTKLLLRFGQLGKNRKYHNLEKYVQEISLALTTHTQSMLHVGAFFEEFVPPLFPELAWSKHWLK